MSRNFCTLYGISRKSHPPYPYKVVTHRQEWTEEELKMLMEMNPGLILDLEEMNDLN